MPTVTPLLARAAGLPVFVLCDSCNAPSRPLDLKAAAARLGKDADLAAACAAGRFRCAACGSRKAMLMPTLSSLIVGSQRLRMRCVDCGRDAALTAVQACDRFGVATPFDAMRAQLACVRGADCRMNAGAMLTDELTVREAAAVRDRLRQPSRPAKSDKVRDCGWL